MTRLSPPLAAVLALIAGGAAWAEPQTITFLHVNDLDQAQPDDEAGGGMAPLATLVREARAANPNTLFVFGGDTISPSLISGFTQGSHMIELFNMTGLDAAVPGNHEFDFGPEVAVQRFQEATFPFVATNIVDAATNEPLPGTVTSHLATVGDYAVGFVGLTTPETAVLASPGPNVRFADPVEAATGAVSSLKDQGADLVVALTHQPLSEDLRLLAEVEDVDLVLGGHDHDSIAWRNDDGLIVKAGDNAEYLAIIDVVVDRVEDDGETEVVWRPAWSFEPTLGVAPEPEVAALVAGYEERLDAELGQPVGEAGVTLDSRRGTVRGEESNFGNFIADAMRAATGADVALTNGGGIRGDRTYEAGTVLTRRDILSELPFGNVVVVTELSGADLMAALENGVSQVEEGAGRFPQVSGMGFAFDPQAPAGSRVTEATVNGEPLDPAATYTVATNDYMLEGGDGYASLGNGRVVIDPAAGSLMASTVMNYATAQGGTIAPKVEGRITRLD